jgi:hypothetical protein
MVYFKMQDLIGNNCIDAYNEYIHLTNWLNEHIPIENWHFDLSCRLLINGILIPSGIKFYNFADAIDFIRNR